ncbi:hypothetical protein RB195_000377 [Necator americanus]|uniref:Uncharacterized protein n=2 Tax=Necator americanus TaxID=51031 RepID=A0ABR1D9E1_NECAM
MVVPLKFEDSQGYCALNDADGNIFILVRNPLVVNGFKRVNAMGPRLGEGSGNGVTVKQKRIGFGSSQINSELSLVIVGGGGGGGRRRKKKKEVELELELELELKAARVGRVPLRSLATDHKRASPPNYKTGGACTLE